MDMDIWGKFGRYGYDVPRFSFRLGSVPITQRLGPLAVCMIIVTRLK